MKSDELKNLIRTYVRQALNEALAEKYLQNIVKEAVSESLQAANLIRDSRGYDEPAPRPAPRRAAPSRIQENVEPQAQKAMRNLGVRDPIMAEIFKDTLASNNPIITGEENAAVEVTEAAMEKVGVFDRDWSKFIK